MKTKLNRYGFAILAVLAMSGRAHAWTTVFKFRNYVSGKTITTTVSGTNNFIRAYNQAAIVSGCNGYLYTQTNSAVLATLAPYTGTVSCDNTSFNFGTQHAGKGAQCFIAAIGSGNPQPDFTSTPPSRCAGASISYPD